MEKVPPILHQLQKVQQLTRSQPLATFQRNRFSNKAGNAQSAELYLHQIKAIVRFVARQNTVGQTGLDQLVVNGQIHPCLDDIRTQIQARQFHWAINQKHQLAITSYLQLIVRRCDLEIRIIRGNHHVHVKKTSS